MSVRYFSLALLVAMFHETSFFPKSACVVGKSSKSIPGWSAANVEASQLLFRGHFPEVADEVGMPEYHLPKPPRSSRSVVECQASHCWLYSKREHIIQGQQHNCQARHCKVLMPRGASRSSAAIPRSVASVPSHTQLAGIQRQDLP